MNWDKIERNRKEFGGKFRGRWGKLTHGDILVIQGKYEVLLGKLQKLYGYKKDEAA